MDFIDQLKQFSKRVASFKDMIQTEEATKTSIIMPFFSLLGYDVFNPDEFVPEFTADVGIKKGEKVDYAIVKDGDPVILIEAKWIGEPLEKHDSQLFRYFSTSKAKFAILTNGIAYRFFTDLEEPNKMDEKPFMEINILDIKESYVSELKKFHKSSFDVREIIDTASELKYSNEIKQLLSKELQSPSDELINYFLSNIYPGKKTQSVVEKFRPIIKKSFNQFINETMNDKLKTILDAEVPKPEENTTQLEETVEKQQTSKIVTTNDELEAYFIIKNLLREICNPEDITYKDTESYFGILYKNNVRKWICRLQLHNQKVLIIPDENKKDNKICLESLYEIENYSEQLLEVVKRYM